ncbi:MAG: methyltransferase domain-containing protein [Fibrobacter sp.]|nr:methyltransferase domain-containing protein [Fibrobacter sp.]
MKQRIAQQFSLQAHRYDQNSAIQELLAQRMAGCFMEPMGKVIDVGSGTGHLATHCLSHGAQSIQMLDLSDAMLDIAKQRILDSKPYFSVQTWAGDAETYVPEQKFNWIISSAALQWFENPAKFIAHSKKWLRPQGVCALGSFGGKSWQELRQAYQQALGQKLDNATHDIDAHLLQKWMMDAGYHNVQTFSEIVVQQWNTPRELLRHLKYMGVTGVKTRPPLKRQELLDLEQALVQPDGTIKLTWELVWARGYNQ